MFRLLGKIAIFGSEKSLFYIRSVAPIINGEMVQSGTARKCPDRDSWVYSSPWYTFSQDELNLELQSFLSLNTNFGKYLNDNPEIKFATLSLCPVEQNTNELFSSILSNKTLELITHSKLSLEIAPASVMPDVVSWSDFLKNNTNSG